MSGFVLKMAIWCKATMVDTYQGSALVHYLKESHGWTNGHDIELWVAQGQAIYQWKCLIATLHVGKMLERTLLFKTTDEHSRLHLMDALRSNQNKLLLKR